MNLPAVFKRSAPDEANRDQIEYALDEWIAYINEFFYNGNGYITQGVNQTMPGQRQEPIGPAYRALTEMAYKSDSVVFACMATRALHFSEVRFQFQRLKDGRPSGLFGTADLQPLETPWVGGTTGDRALTRHVLNAVIQIMPRGDARFARVSRTRQGGNQDSRVIDALDAAAMAHFVATMTPEPKEFGAVAFA